jgi:dihydrofolate reductase
MAKLIYSTIASLDGYVADEDGGFGWAAPDEQVHAFINDFERGLGTYLYGRRLYEVMRFWETYDATSGRPSVGRDYAQIWRSTDKIVYSRTLRDVSSARTRIEHDFDAAAVRREKAQAERDIGVGGPGLAARALEAGLVDELRLFVVPIVVGGGTRSLPDHVRLELELLDERRFDGGMVYLHYRILGSDEAHQRSSRQ